MQNKHFNRAMNPESALQRLMAICSRKEVSEGELVRKLQRWAIEPDKQEEILETLRKHNFVDNLRFAKAFVNDKSKFNKWGPRKIEQALALQNVPHTIIAEAMSAIEVDDDMLTSLLTKKKEAIRAKTNLELRSKLIRFGVSRGFDLELVVKVAKQLVP